MKTVTAAILVNDGQILIAKRKTGDRLANNWEFPGGTVEGQETLQECLKRELEEEFGIKVKVEEYVGENNHHYDHGSIRLIVYRASWLSGDIEPRAHDDVKWVTVDQLDSYDFAPADIPFVEMLVNGIIEI